MRTSACKRGGKGIGDDSTIAGSLAGRIATSTDRGRQRSRSLSSRATWPGHGRAVTGAASSPRDGRFRLNEVELKETGQTPARSKETDNNRMHQTRFARR